MMMAGLQVEGGKVRMEGLAVGIQASDGRDIQIFFTGAKLAISETYQGTDSQFLDSEKDTFRDDGSTASTAVLVDNHLYVANVGDSGTIILAEWRSRKRDILVVRVLHRKGLIQHFGVGFRCATYF
ncbi:hypothetical protein Ahy_B05g076036 [Arachis hypogaea]|uniref:PPM-type phosphatase domain-containing protein n=1 Tax=Arachis hypogaea TaxID=3818 RepID=A0A444Z2F4_ARAHY|nr:hypothetical protein Ahy_B05g076036 [Arachis hypogaea]